MRSSKIHDEGEQGENSSTSFAPRVLLGNGAHDSDLRRTSLGSAVGILGESNRQFGGLKRSKSFSERQALSDTIVEDAIKESKIGHVPSIAILHPASQVMRTWTLVALFVVLYISLSVPFTLTFQPKKNETLQAVDIAIEMFLIADVFLNFRTGYYPFSTRSDLVVMDPRQIMENYLRSWFFFDFISAIPLDTITLILKQGEFTGGNILKLLRLGRFARLVKMIKLATFSALPRRLDDFYVDMLVTTPGLSKGLGLVSLAFAGLITVHYVACGWWAISLIYPNKSWAVVSGALGKSVPQQYLLSVSP